MTRLGTWRATYLVSLSCVGSFLFAYDTGIVGGVLTLDSFVRDMGFSDKERDNVTSLSASLLQAGGSLIFNIGAVLQLFYQHGIATWYAGRTISGIGAGIATVIIPMYSAEMAPKEIRGQLGSLFQFFFTLGVAVSYWVDYGAAQHIPSSTRQWRVPVALQLVPGGILGLGMFLTKESARWLAQRDRHEEALESLIWVRGGDSTEVRMEFQEIVAGIEEEERQTAGVTWREYWLPANRYRIFIAVTLQIGAQLTGNTPLAYFSPQVFQAVGAGQNALLLSGFFGVCKVISCAFFLIFLVERIGRRWSLLAGSFLMGTYMFIIAVLTQRHPPVSGGTLTPPAIASLTMVFLEAMTFNISWGPIPWLYMSEIFPTRVREGGIAVGAATQWLFGFTLSQITPAAVNNLGYKAFLMFCCFNWALVLYTWFFIKETKGLSLEEMEIYLLLSVREFWFEHLSGPDSLVMPTTDENKRWFFGGADFDKLCVERFAPTLEQLRRDGIKSGQDIIYALQPNDSHDWLSLILLLDQIPRNCYRGDSADVVFNYFDPMAREVALTAIQRGIPERCPEVRWRFAYRSWFYVPLMHSEDISLHDLAVEKYEGLARDVESLLPSEMAVEWSDESEVAHEYRAAAQRVVQADEKASSEYAQLSLGFEKRHWAIIKRFGRYPHRNRVMGRETTDEERDYLENGGETFGG
ncbi:hypothetical protein ACSS6W_004014 [Trichoderma asperelloides]